MSISNENSNPNKTASYFYKANNYFAVCGLPSFIKWQENSNLNTRIYNCIQKVVTVCMFILVFAELASYITQKNLSEKQAYFQFILSFSHPFYIFFYFLIIYHLERIKDLLQKLCISLKNVYNDPEVEEQMIKKTTAYSGAFVLNTVGALASYGLSGLSQFIGSDGTFATVITVYPDVADKGICANLVRLIMYLLWWIVLFRVVAIYALAILTTGCLGYQFKQLQNYFYSLNDIFDSSETDHENCEQKYEDAVKVGIQLHADTLWCTKQCQIVCSPIYSAQIIVNALIVCMFMMQMARAERTLSNVCELVLTAISLLSTTGILMWNAGDITIEAALVPTAMYSSGWQNCRGKSSQRIRKLLVIAIAQAQRHVVIRGFGIIDISHQACVSILKASYSIFSLLY